MSTAASAQNTSVSSARGTPSARDVKSRMASASGSPRKSRAGSPSTSSSGSSPSSSPAAGEDAAAGPGAPGAPGAVATSSVSLRTALNVTSQAKRTSSSVSSTQASATSP